MKTSMCGPGVNLVPGDVTDCFDAETAQRLIDRNMAEAVKEAPQRKAATKQKREKAVKPNPVEE